MKENILVMLTAYKARKARFEREKAELENDKNAIIEYMEKHSTREIDLTSIKAKLTECTRKSLDEKAIRKEHPEIAEQYEQVTKYDRFTVV